MLRCPQHDSTVTHTDVRITLLICIIGLHLTNCQQSIHTLPFRLLYDSNRASAHEALCARGLSARLVSTIGTRAPNTMPVVCASARYSNCFASILPASRSGTTRISA